jgi:hypothetical protein
LDEFVQFNAAELFPSAALPSAVFPLLVSRKDTVPVGDTALPDPVTVAVSV